MARVPGPPNLMSTDGGMRSLSPEPWAPLVIETVAKSGVILVVRHQAIPAMLGCRRRRQLQHRTRQRIGTNGLPSDVGRINTFPYMSL